VLIINLISSIIKLPIFRLLIVLMLLFAPHLSLASPICSLMIKESKGQATLLGKAGWLANVRGTNDSLKVQTGKLLEEAKNNLSTAKRPNNLCNNDCFLIESPKIVFNSTPRKFLSNYKDLSLCASLEAETTAKPLLYPDKKFDSLESFHNWFSDFSQGSGTDGKDLYNKCGGQCSPQYKSILSFSNDDSRIRATVEVICGHARDKSDDTYLLSYAYLWTCEDTALDS
jgi:hypothetical protein